MMKGEAKNESKVIDYFVCFAFSQRSGGILKGRILH